MLHVECRKKGYLLGKGYGDLKYETIRISNLPSISVNRLDELLGCIDSVLS